MIKNSNQGGPASRYSVIFCAFFCATKEWRLLEQVSRTSDHDSSVSHANDFTAQAESRKCRFPRAIHYGFPRPCLVAAIISPHKMAAKNHQLSWHCHFKLPRIRHKTLTTNPIQNKDPSELLKKSFSNTAATILDARSCRHVTTTLTQLFSPRALTLPSCKSIEPSLLWKEGKKIFSPSASTKLDLPPCSQTDKACSKDRLVCPVGLSYMYRDVGRFYECRK